MEIGATMRELRKAKGLTQVQVAEEAGISVNSLRLYEAGKRQPNIKQIKAIFKALDEKIVLLDDDDPATRCERLIESMKLDEWLTSIGIDAHHINQGKEDYWLCITGIHERNLILFPEDVSEIETELKSFIKFKLIEKLKQSTEIF